MALFDLPLEQLETYRPERQEPDDFNAFWQATLAEARGYPLQARFERVELGLQAQETYDVTFNGFGGQPVKGWLILPAQRADRLPCVVEYIGYGGGRGFAFDWLLWSSMGYAHLVMDTRGQGSAWRQGDTPDASDQGGGPAVPGFMTRGILDPEQYYYRRLITDAVRAVETARSHPAIDPQHVAATGGSQGGGLALIVAGLVSDLDITMPDVPFLCHYRRATELVDTAPYSEIARYCHTHRDQVEAVFTTLPYFDGVNFAAHAHARALFSVGLMDQICPPSTVYAAYNHYAGPKEIRVYPYNEHEGGENFQTLEKMRFLQRFWG